MYFIVKLFHIYSVCQNYRIKVGDEDSINMYLLMYKRYVYIYFLKATYIFCLVYNVIAFLKTSHFLGKKTNCL